MEVFPNWTSIPIIVFILTLTFILNRTFFAPLGKTLEERRKRIEGARIEADEIRKTSEQRLAEIEQRMREARRESDQRMAQIRNMAMAERNQLLSARKAETDKMMVSARADLQRKTEEARRTLESQSQTFAYKIASQILKRPLARSEQKGAPS